MRSQQIALQLYTLRDHCRTAADFADTVRRVRAIGYTAVQLSGVGPIPEDEIVRITRGEGITLCATHEPADQILERPAEVADRLHRLGCRVTAYPFPRNFDVTQSAEIDRLAAALDAAGATLREAGCLLCYHNHALEFHRVGQETGLERLLVRTKPENLQLELDTYWVQFGGGDPVAWCEKMKGRLPLLHLKDYALDANHQPTFAAIGGGTLPFDRIIPAAERSGCEWFIVEQDTVAGDPFEAVRRSYVYLSQNLAG